jgi:hypothetical protein
VHGEPRRFALLLGANHGDGEEVHLRHAEKEAQRLGEILRSVGDFDARDVVVLAHPSRSEVEQALELLRARVQESQGETMLLVYYSGHADAEALHLAGERFPLTALREAVTSLPASARVLVVDACRSGAITRVKGGRPGPSFDVQVDASLGARGLAILTSSGAGEDAQESDEVGSSLFTHFFLSALIGAGDRDGDGVITLEEAFAYASERTVLASSASQAGPQHPTFRYELGGHGGLVLTRPGLKHARFGWVQFPEPGWYLLRRKDGPLVADLRATRGGQKLALQTGRYELNQRMRDFYLEGEVDIAPGTATLVSTGVLRRRSYPTGARKGGDLDWIGSGSSVTPLYRRWWLWTIVGAAAVGLGVGLGVGLSQRSPTTLNPITF